jgi:nitroreductase
MHVNGLSYERDLCDLPEHTVNYANFLGFLSHRRSVRNFQDTPVQREILQEILDAIALAPFGAAPHDVHMTVVNNREVIASALPKIAEFLDNIVTWLNNPVMRFMIRRKTSRETFNTLAHHVYPMAKLGNYRLEYGDSITRGAPALLIFHAEKGAESHTHNSLTYATYAMLAAHSLGLGSTMNGLVPAAINKVKDVRKIFHIPVHHEAIISVIFGYSKYQYRRAITRKVQPVSWID